jgi:ketosteroid isomerase-like protein
MASNFYKITLALSCVACIGGPTRVAAGNVMVQDITEKKGIASASTPVTTSTNASPELKDNVVSEKVLPNPPAKPSGTDYQGWEIDAGGVKISCINPNAACIESEHVLDTLKVLFKAYSKGDLITAAQYMDDDCTTVDDASHELIVGKKAVLADLKNKIHGWEVSDSPLISYTMEHPYAKVDGDMAVVSFVAIKEFGGKNPKKFKSHCTDIFKKENGIWKKVHYRSNWKEVVASASN